MQGAIPERKIPLKENNKPAKRVDIGGQAVLEGVMMRSPEYIALAVRRPDGSVVCKRDPYVSPAKKHKWMGWPFVRGAVSMVTMLGTGMKTLEESSKMGGVEDEQPTRFELWLAKKLGKGVDKVVMGLAIVLAVCLSVGLFVLIPNAIIKLFPTTATGRHAAAQESGYRPCPHGHSAGLYGVLPQHSGYEAGIPLSWRGA